jgi:hypothetical protein
MYCQYHGRNIDKSRCSFCPNGDFNGENGKCSKERRIPSKDKPRTTGRNVRKNKKNAADQK